MKKKTPSLIIAALLAAPADTFYWDNNTTTPGFGTAGGTWSSAGSTLWNGDSTGGSAGGLLGTTITTSTSDALNFGTATDGLDAGTISVSGTVNANNLTFGSASGAVLISGGIINLAGTTPTITLNNAADTIGSDITGTIGFTKDGSGTLTLSSANSFTGDIIVNNGTLTGTVAGAFGSFSAARTLNVNSGGILDFGAGGITGNHNSTTANLVIGDGGTVTNSGTDPFNPLNNVTLNGGTLTSTGGISTGQVWGAWHINGTVTSTGTSLIDGAATNGRHIRLNANADNTNFDVQTGTLTVSAPLWNGWNTGNTAQRTSTLTKLGGGTLTLSSSNSFSGAITVNNGTLTGTVAGAFGSGTRTINVDSNGILDFNTQNTAIPQEGLTEIGKSGLVLI